MTTSEPDYSRRTTFTRRLPKLELHAHLNGSIRRSTLLALAASRSIDPSHTQILTRWPSTLSEAFSVFSVIHSCVTTLADVERIAFEVGEDLEADGVVYAEIRTTPRSMEGGGLEGYVEVVLRGLGKYREGGGVVLRLILSIDRAKHSAVNAKDIVQLAAKYRSQGVVGIDLSGDPTKGSIETFLPALSRARSLGLKITLHAGEVPNTDPEMSAMLNFIPDRFGHCCFVSPSNLNRLKATKVPIELCLTSNLLSNSVETLENHHFGLHYRPDEEGTVCCISTDDSGVFGSALSNEYRLVMDAFALGERETFALTKRTMAATFLADGGEGGTEAESKDAEDRERIQASFDGFDKSWDWK